jgi:hypothetical protein
MTKNNIIGTTVARDLHTATSNLKIWTIQIHIREVRSDKGYHLATSDEEPQEEKARRRGPGKQTPPHRSWRGGRR